MKKILLTLAAVVCILACACSKQGPRKVEKPYVAAQISNQLFAEAVELTDTATIVTFRSVQRPGWWIEVDSGAVISADGRTYAMTSSSIALNEHITMGESGDTVFTLTFRPVPSTSSRVPKAHGRSTASTSPALLPLLHPGSPKVCPRKSATSTRPPSSQSLSLRLLPPKSVSMCSAIVRSTAK